MLRFCLLTAFVASLLSGQFAHAEHRILKTTEVSIAFFSTAGVVFYSISENAVGIEASICAGGEVGGKVMGVGASEKIHYCIDWKVSAKLKKKPADRKEQVKAIEEFINSDVHKKEFLAEFKKQLKKASDEDLKAIGINRQDIDKIENVKFGSAQDETNQRDKVINILKNCAPLSSIPNS